MLLMCALKSSLYYCSTCQKKEETPLTTGSQARRAVTPSLISMKVMSRKDPVKEAMEGPERPAVKLIITSREEIIQDEYFQLSTRVQSGCG